MADSIEPVHVDEAGYETHPAFGVVTVSRSHGDRRVVFQSDIEHNDTIRVRVFHADRRRNLTQDWVHPTQQILEIEMSLAQWGELVSSIGIGSGVPVTLRSTESRHHILELEFAPRVEVSLSEVDSAVDTLLEDITTSLTDVEEAIESKAGIRATRDAMRKLRSCVENARPNARYVVTALSEAAEKVVSQSKADIEATILHAYGAVTGVDTPAALGGQTHDSGRLTETRTQDSHEDE